MCCGVWLTRNNMIFEGKSNKSDFVASYNLVRMSFREGWKVKINKTFRIIKNSIINRQLRRYIDENT